MSTFKRGISDEFVEALNRLYEDENSFWYKIVNDNDLFIAIRDGYLNVYYKGQSLCKLSYVKSCVKGETHKKYLGFSGKGYFSSKNGVISNENAKIKDLSETDSIKEYIEGYIGKEKLESYAEILGNDINVIDVEITFVKDKVPNPIRKADYETSSIDYLALKGDSLVFYEAKHFSNSEIRSRNTPKVFGQISRYEDALIEHENEILSTYEKVLQNLKDLNILNGLSLPIKLKIDYSPRLIVFDVPMGVAKDAHLNKLRMKFAKRLILKP